MIGPGDATWPARRPCPREGWPWPTLPIFRPLFHIYFYRLVPLLGRVVAGQGEAYRYLPHSLTHFLSPEELKAVMEEAGLSKVEYRRLMLGTVAVHVGVKG